MNAASSARLPPIPPITHGSVKPDGLTISLTAKDVAVGGNQRKLANKRGQIGDYESGGSFDFNNEILDTKNIFFGNSESTDKPFNGPFALQVISEALVSINGFHMRIQGHFTSCNKTKLHNRWGRNIRHGRLV